MREQVDTFKADLDFHAKNTEKLVGHKSEGFAFTRHLDFVCG